ncbi:MAG: tRNA (adenosine(37)-N6)-threonylcarbamoyltransferase complex ATPase subunit type 1 TsaE [bacterium]
MQSFDIQSQHAMLELGRAWAGALDAGAVVFLSGDLGAGKTTLARGILDGLGHRGAVTSPTYTLVERYALARGAVYHLDLYRLDDPTELEMTGLRDWLDGDAIVLIEWPERGAGRMPKPSWRVEICYRDGVDANVDANANSVDGVAVAAAADMRRVRVQSDARRTLPAPC